MRNWEIRSWLSQIGLKLLGNYLPVLLEVDTTRGFVQFIKNNEKKPSPTSYCHLPGRLLSDILIEGFGTGPANWFFWRKYTELIRYTFIGTFIVVVTSD